MYVDFDYLCYYLSFEIDAYYRYKLMTKKPNVFLFGKGFYNHKYDLLLFQSYHHGRIFDVGFYTDFNTSNVLYMTYFFRYYSQFNENISDWDVSNVIDMSYLFYDCHKFNQPLNSWDVSKVTNMHQMFDGCRRDRGVSV